MKKLQRGSIMVYTLLSLMVLSAFLSLIYERAIGLMKSSREWMWFEKSQVAVESAAALVEARLLEDPMWSSGENGEPEFRFALDGAEMSVRTERFRPPDIVWIFSNARYKRYKKDTVRPVILQDPTLFGVMARRRLKLGEGVILSGSACGSEVFVDAGAVVVGAVISTGSLSMPSRSPDAIPFDSAMSPPHVPKIDMSSHAAAYARLLRTDLIADTVLLPGTYRREGDLTVRGAVETGVSIWVRGNLTMEGNVQIRAARGEDTPLFIVDGDVRGRFEKARVSGIIFAGGNISLQGEGLITGTVIGENVELSGGVVVRTFDNTGDEPRPASGFWPRRIRGIRQ